MKVDSRNPAPVVCEFLLDYSARHPDCFLQNILCNSLRLLHLFSDKSPVCSDAQTIGNPLRADVDLDMKGLDMVFFAMPDMPPQAMVQEQVIVAAAPSVPVSAVGKMTYGVCQLFYATEDDRGSINDSSVNSLSASSYLISFLQPDLRERLSTPYGANVETSEWFEKWESSLKVTVLKVPEHGKFVNIKNDPNNEYLPDVGYVGKDRIDLLVEGKDDLGRPIAMTLRYFIHVLPSKELKKTSDSRVYWQMIKHYCGKNKHFWHISDIQNLTEQAIGQSGNLIGSYVKGP